MAVPARAFIAEIPRHHPFTLGYESHTVPNGHLVPVHGFVAAVPDAENDAPFSGAVDLHAEIAPVPAAGHVVGPERVFQAGHLAIERVDPDVLGHGVKQMDGGCIPPGLEIEMG